MNINPNTLEFKNIVNNRLFCYEILTVNNNLITIDDTLTENKVNKLHLDDLIEFKRKKPVLTERGIRFILNLAEDHDVKIFINKTEIKLGE